MRLNNNLFERNRKQFYIVKWSKLMCAQLVGKHKAFILWNPSYIISNS